MMMGALNFDAPVTSIAAFFRLYFEGARSVLATRRTGFFLFQPLQEQ
jgi:hypothetical protein